jgi:hypothetical protein
VTTPSKPLPEEPNLDIEIFDNEPHYLQSGQPSNKDASVYAEGEWAVGNMVVVCGVVKYLHLFSDTKYRPRSGTE